MALQAKEMRDDREFQGGPFNRMSYDFCGSDSSASISCDFLNSSHTIFFQKCSFFHPRPPFSRLFFFLTGGASVRARGSSIYNLVPGVIYLLPSNQPFEVIYQPSVVCAYHVHVYDFTGRSLFDKVKGVPEIRDDVLFEAIVSKIEDGNDRFAQIASFQAVCMFLEPIMEDILSKASRASRYGKLMEIVTSGKAPDMSIDKLAKKMGMSRAALSKGFKRAMGVSLKDYIIDMQIDRGGKLLSGTDKTVLEIADVLGFADASYFHRIFKKRTGVAPCEYRKRIWQISDIDSFQD